MLRVVYKAADLKDGTISDWREDRGLVEIRVARRARPEQFVPSLNATLKDFLSKAEWYQMWRGEIVSISSPDSPLRVFFELSRVPSPPPVDIREDRGYVALHVSPTATLDQILVSLNPSIEKFLAGGQWFQLWNGEIVTMDSPDGMAA